MAGPSLNPTVNYLGKIHRLSPIRHQSARCCSSSSPDNNGNRRSRTKTPQLLKLAVSGITELLRLVSSGQSRSLDEVITVEEDEVSVSGVDDVLRILKSDYENAYFVTGVFTGAIYADDCIFEDPTIRFQGKQLYSRNLKLLVPFFDSPSIGLQTIEKGANSETNIVLAKWRLRTYLKLPWRPLISIDGTTLYELDDKFLIVRHAESWSVSALEAVGQIFTPTFGRPKYSVAAHVCLLSLFIFTSITI